METWMKAIDLGSDFSNVSSPFNLEHRVQKKFVFVFVSLLGKFQTFRILLKKIILSNFWPDSQLDLFLIFVCFLFFKNIFFANQSLIQIHVDFNSATGFSGLPPAWAEKLVSQGIDKVFVFCFCFCVFAFFERISVLLLGNGFGKSRCSVKYSHDGRKK